MKSFLKFFYSKLKNVSPSLYYLSEYHRSSRKIRLSTNARDQLFMNFLSECNDRRCLQIGVKDEIGEKFGTNWISVDLYDKSNVIDYHYDIHDLKFEDESFDAVVCWSILEHIPFPQQGIKELYRVLKPGAKIWVQLPFLFPYHEAPKDYWRVTPDGLRIWMKDFKEIDCNCNFWDKTSLIAATYFYGTK